MQKLKFTLLLSILFTAPFSVADAFKAGFSAVDITPYDFEIAPLKPGDPLFKYGDKFHDTGVDRLYDHEEPGALGVDGKPGIAGFDDDQDGTIDNCDRAKCDEYLAEFSDDKQDPNHDNYHPILNPTGTERDLRFQYVAISGFNPYYPFPFFPNRLANGIHDPIWARGIALESTQGVKTVLIATDLPGLAWKHINPVKRQIEKVYGIPFANIVITSNHVHSAPDAAGYWVSIKRGHNKWYTDKLKIWMFNAAASAIRNMRPATMKTIQTRHIACYNATTRVWKKDPECNIPMSSVDYNLPGGEKYDAEALQNDKRDPKVRNTEITAVQFTGIADGKPLGTFINWHNHPESLGSKNMLISGDFIHNIIEYVEKHMGGGTAVYFTGTLGGQIGTAYYVPGWTADMMPVYEENPDAFGNTTRKPADHERWEFTRSVGYEVGSEVVKALKEKQEVLTQVDISVRSEPLDIAPVNFLHFLTTGSVWRKNVEPEDAMVFYPGRCMWRYGCVRNDVSLLQIGDLSILTAPGEIDPAYWFGRKESTSRYGGKWGDEYFPAMEGAQKHLKGPYTAVLGQANNYLSYLVPKSDNIGSINFKHPNHYEEFVTVNKYFGDDLGNKWMQMVGSKYRYNKRRILPK